MPLLGFQKQFVPKVESGEKRQTIRKRRKHPIKIGDTLYLYFGLRTKHSRKLREEICTNVIPITIRVDGVLVGDEWIPADEIDEFARSDGFADGATFYAFWRKEHGLSEDNPLDGFDLIQWEQKVLWLDRETTQMTSREFHLALQKLVLGRHLLINPTTDIREAKRLENDLIRENKGICITTILEGGIRPRTMVEVWWDAFNSISSKMEHIRQEEHYADTEAAAICMAYYEVRTGIRVVIVDE